MHRDTVYKNLDTIEISPVLLRAYAYNLNNEDWKYEKFPERYIENYELELILKSEGSVMHEGKQYQLKPGDLCFKKPGEKTQGIKPYSCYTIVFTMTNNDYSSHFEPTYHNDILQALPPVYPTKNLKYFEIIFKEIIIEYLSGRISSIIKIKSHILAVLYTIYEEIQQNYLPASPYHGVISKALKYFEENYQDKITLEEIARHIDMSPFHFHKIFKQTMLITPNDYLNNIRINHAKRLLVLTSDSIIDIAFKCGFESASYFCYCFKHKMDITPNKYRKLHRRI